MGEQLALRHVQKHYGAVRAVHGTDLEIAAGEFVSIVGPSGSGKTTLLTMIAGFEDPTSGVIMVGEANVTGLAPHCRNIGMVFQRYALFPHMTVRQNILFPLKMRRLARGKAATAKVDAMLDLIEMRDFQHRYPGELSGGQQQRVAVARALVFDPPVLLMDEPLGALDKSLRESMQIEIRKLQQRTKATVVYVTHDQEEALTMSDRVAVMRNGRLEQIGTPDELYRQPMNAFVAGFVGSINLIPGTIRHKDHAGISVKIGETSLTVNLSQLFLERPVSHGLPVRLAARPEHLSIVEPGSKGEGVFKATIETVIFAGATKKALVRPDCMPDLVLRVDVASSVRLPERGGDVTIAVESGAVAVFDAANGCAR